MTEKEKLELARKAFKLARELNKILSILYVEDELFAETVQEGIKKFGY